MQKRKDNGKGIYLSFYDLGYEVGFGANLIADIDRSFHFTDASAYRGGQLHFE